MEELITKFNEIKKKDWIIGKATGRGNIGLTFEQELGIVQNDLELPDHNGIELKTRGNFSRAYITLFNATFDGPNQLETKRLVNMYGYPDKIIDSVNVLTAKVYGNKLTLIGKKWKFKISVDYKKQKVFLNIYDKDNNFIERERFWSFETLELKLMRKDNILALIEADKKKIDNVDYFKYHTLSIYNYNGFSVFLKLLEIGYIRVGIELGVYRKGRKYGQLYDHGIGFEISRKNLENLYTKIY